MKRAVEGNAWQADHILPVYKVGTILPCLGLLPPLPMALMSDQFLRCCDFERVHCHPV